MQTPNTNVKKLKPCSYCGLTKHNERLLGYKHEFVAHCILEDERFQVPRPEWQGTGLPPPKFMCFCYVCGHGRRAVTLERQMLESTDDEMITTWANKLKALMEEVYE